MKIAQNALELVGNTPLVKLGRIMQEHECKAEVVAKLEKCNPAGSSKDRVAISLIEDAEKRGVLQPGALLIEPTSGNTGVGLAMAAACKGYQLILTMPASMSVERRLLLAAMGAKIVLTDAELGMSGAVKKAEELIAENPGAFMPSQFDNPANPAAHKATAEEILRDTEGEVDVFIACAGTGGTVSGTGRVLKAAKPAVRVIAVEPAESPMISEGRSGAHGIQGIGANFIPENYDASVVDAVMTVSTEEAYQYGRELATGEGLLCGISSGAAVAAAVRLAKMEECAGKRIVALLPDSGERYLSTPMFKE